MGSWRVDGGWAHVAALHRHAVRSGLGQCMGQVPLLGQGATLPGVLLIMVSTVLSRALNARWGSWRTWKATSNCSHGRGSPLGQARRAAISEYAPGAP